MIAKWVWDLAVFVGFVSFADAIWLTLARPGRRYVTRATGARVILGAVECLLVAGACALYLTRRDVVIVPDSPASLDGVRRGLAIAGAFVSLAGAALAGWAKAQLGRLFTAHLGVKENHTLVTDGPYAIVRHPIYLGVILFALGTAGVWNSVAVAGLAVALTICFAVQLRIEEQIFAAHFGSAYEEYRRRVPALLPIFRRGTGL
jgi:protein-S-isoprenylcysteine O-methyltransferase Ste14